MCRGQPLHPELSSLQPRSGVRLLFSHWAAVCSFSIPSDMYSVLGGLSPMGKACQIASISGMILMVSGVLWHMRMPEALLRNLSTSESSKVQ